MTAVETPGVGAPSALTSLFPQPYGLTLTDQTVGAETTLAYNLLLFSGGYAVDLERRTAATPFIGAAWGAQRLGRPHPAVGGRTARSRHGCCRLPPNGSHRKKDVPFRCLAAVADPAKQQTDGPLGHLIDRLAHGCQFRPDIGRDQAIVVAGDREIVGYVEAKPGTDVSPVERCPKFQP